MQQICFPRKSSLQVRIIVDENIDVYIIESLRNANYEVLSIRESYRGIKDIEIIVMGNLVL